MGQIKCLTSYKHICCTRYWFQATNLSNILANWTVLAKVDACITNKIYTIMLLSNREASRNWPKLKNQIFSNQWTYQT